MVLRLLLFFLFLYACWWIFRTPRKKPPAQAAGARPAPAAAASKPLLKAEQMVDCVHCGLHLPASEALRDAPGRAYCTPEHRLAGPRVRR